VEVVALPDGLPWFIILVNLVVMAVLILLWSRFFKLGGGRVEV
jgi:hypothetical protein